jgi:hypothetical protein
MKSSTKVIAKSHAAKTISVVRALSSNAFVNSSMYKLIHSEVLNMEDAVEARTLLFTNYYLPLVPTKSVRGKSVIGAVDTKSPKYTALYNDITNILRSVYILKKHIISKGTDKEIKLNATEADKLKIVAALDMTEKEVRALSETDDKYRIRVHAVDWVKKTRQRYYKSFEAMLDKLRNPVAKAKSKAKSKAKKGKVDLTNTGKGITAEQVIALMINGCAKLNKDKAEAYLDKLAEQLDALRTNVMSGKPVLECEA